MDQSDIRLEKKKYWRQQIAKNNGFFLLICLSVTAIECVMLAVYGLSTTPDFPELSQTYLYYYIPAIGISLLFASGFWGLRKKTRALGVIQLLYVLLLLAWACDFSIFDVSQGNSAYIFAQIIIFVAAGIRLPSALHLSLNGMSYLVFVLGLMASGIDARRFYSELLNIGIIVVLAEIIVLYSNRLHYDHYRMTAMVERQNEKLTHYACYDSLTGLLNRRMIWKALQEAVDQGKPLCCVILDLDDFKRYNDTYGHLAGDDLLKWLGGLLERYAKEWQGAAGRYGGEEFLLVLPAMSEEKAVQCMERLLEDIHHLPGERPMSASAGGCMAVPGLELEKLVSRADKALYLAKCTGKDRFELYRN